MTNQQQLNLISPIDNKIIASRNIASTEEIEKIIAQSSQAQKLWQKVTVEKRAEYCLKAIEYFEQNAELIAREITCQMGRPIRYTKGEIKGLAERARYMIDIAAKQLQDVVLQDDEKAKRFIRAIPLGIVFTIAPWNYPYLTAINSIIPALMAGNCVLLKHSQQTLLSAETFAEAFKSAGLPHGVFDYLHLDHPKTKLLLQHPAINFISFTGSVNGGKIIEQDTAGLFKSVALELGGKDPAYVRADANLNFAVENLVDGAFFNSGQSCCGIERIYVDEKIYDPFVKSFVAQVKNYRLGDPLDPETTLGPMINQQAANFVRNQITQAIQSGAIAEIDPADFTLDNGSNNYLAPQVLTQVNHQMNVMTEESFGPIVGIMRVKNDQEAIQLINDSHYGLTASLWTTDESQAMVIADSIATGTVFINRCDYLDPGLAWSGVKQSGRGCALSHLGYQQLTRPKSFHFKREIS
jgi:acyl-CoA reductase-like NAD-dependent aldehyde dehydrogenase